jgi:hypothetical protein
LIQLIVVALFASFACYVYFLSQSVYLGWLSLLAVQFYQYSFGINQVIAGGIHLDAVDIVSLGLLAAGFIRTLPLLRERNTARMIGLGYLAIFTLSLIRGIVSNGLTTAANEARGFVPIILAVLYFLTAPVDSDSVRKYIQIYLYFGIGFVVVALLAYAGLPVGGVAWLHSTYDPTDTIGDRLLPAAAALGVALSFVFSLSWANHRGSNALFRWLPVIFLGTAVFLRHRSVWNVLLFGVASLFFTDNRLFRRLIPVAVLSLAVVAAFASVASITASSEAADTASSTEAEFSDSATNQGTLIWRVQTWTSILLGKDQTLTTIVFGKSLGEGYNSFDLKSGFWSTSPPHSEYLSEYSRVGILGLALMLWFILRPIRRLWSLSLTDMLAVEPSASAWVVVIIAAIVYGVTYWITVDTFALVGIASAVVANQDADITVPLSAIMPRVRAA